MKFKIAGILILAVSLMGAACNSAEDSASPTPSGQVSGSAVSVSKEIVAQRNNKYAEYPPMNIDQNKRYLATMDTNFGRIVIELFQMDAPVAVNSFLFLARAGFYDGIRFHRVSPGFVIQAGDPTGTGFGGPGYAFPDEEVKREYVKGIVAMANGGPNTNGSQFFITLGDLRQRLPKNYTIIGLVVEGIDVVDRIGEVPVEASSSGEISSPVEDVVINSVKIDES